MSFARTFFGIETTAAVTPHILDFEIYKLALFEYRKANESKSIDFLLSIGFMHFSFHVYCLSKSPAGMHWRSISIYVFSWKLGSTIRAYDVTLPNFGECLEFEVL